MCRSIKPLYHLKPPATDTEIRAAARQFVRKISGFTQPSKINEAAFEATIADIATSSKQLLKALRTKAPLRSRAESPGSAK